MAWFHKRLPAMNFLVTHLTTASVVKALVDVRHSPCLSVILYMLVAASIRRYVFPLIFELETSWVKNGLGMKLLYIFSMLVQTHRIQYRHSC